MITDQMRLFTGVVSVQVSAGVGLVSQYNEVWTLWARSLDEATGYASRQALTKYPKGAIVYQGMYDITEIASNKPITPIEGTSHADQ